MDVIIQSLAVFENIFSSSTSYVKEKLSADIPKLTKECRWGFLVRDCVSKVVAFRAPSASR
jgi:hypothetical protein